MNKKIVNLLFALIFCVGMTFTFTACGTSYTSKPGTIDEIAGTYQLTSYQLKDSNGDKYDALTQNEIVAYMIVDKDGFGYYIYKDKNTALTYDTNIYTFNYDPDDNTKIKSLEYQTGKNHVYAWDKKPGCGDEPTMGVSVYSDKTTLNYTIYESHYKIGKQVTNIPYSSALYAKISNDTTLTYVNQQLNQTLQELPRYEFKNITNKLVFKCTADCEYDIYDYCIVDFDPIASRSDNGITANIYYKLKTDAEGTVTNQNLNVEYNKTIDNSIYSVVLTIMNTQYGLSINPYYQRPGDIFVHQHMTDITLDYSEHFEVYHGDETNIQGIITDITSANYYFTYP